MNNTIKKYNLDLMAWVILPDHFHLIIDFRGLDVSNIIQRMKMSFAAYYRKRMDLNSGRVWQHRFWDHIIRDEKDMNRHIDYIHYNPVKHGYVTRPIDWEESSIHNFIKRGLYTRDWENKETPGFNGDYGE
jgi:putative transposase